MGPASYMRSVVDRNVVMRRIPVICTHDQKRRCWYIYIYFFLNSWIRLPNMTYPGETKNRLVLLVTVLWIWMAKIMALVQNLKKKRKKEYVGTAYFCSLYWIFNQKALYAKSLKLTLLLELRILFLHIRVLEHRKIVVNDGRNSKSSWIFKRTTKVKHKLVIEIQSKIKLRMWENQLHTHYLVHFQ